MPKILGRTILVITMISMITGCASVKKTAEQIDVRGYVRDEPRVDQEVSGTVGNWENAPPAQDTNTKDTRKMYYLEFTKDADPDVVSDQFYEHESTTTRTVVLPDETVTPPPKTRQRLSLPSFDDDEPAAPAQKTDTAGAIRYKVEKDDTLQKISKKFYNTYSKWPQIYEANKDVIKDPNFIKPGIVLTIPKE